jgi:hypothetical protein
MVFPLRTKAKEHLRLCHGVRNPLAQETTAATAVPKKFHQRPTPPKDDFTPEEVKEAKEKEMASWEEKKVSLPISESEGKKILQDKSKRSQLLDWRWVIVRKADGKVKARAVVRGFKDRRKDIDFNCPTAKVEALRVFEYFSLSKKDPAVKADVRTAFLNAGAPADCCLLIRPLTATDNDVPDGYWKLQKALYGLKDAPRLWYEEVHGTLVAKGWKPTIHEPCFFTKKTEDGTVSHLLILYVDDMQAVGEDATEHIKDLGYQLGTMETATGSTFLGVHIQEDKDGLFLHQASWLEGKDDLVKDTGGSFTSPLPSRLPEPDPDSPTLNAKDHTRYRAIIGALQWLQRVSRPDLAYAVNFLSRFQASPTQECLRAAERVWHFARQTTKESPKGIHIPRPSDDDVLTVYCDGAHAAKRDKGYGQTGWILGIERPAADGRMEFYPLSWRSAQQKRVTRSSTDAEMWAAEDAMTHIAYFRALLAEIGIRLPCVLKADSKNIIDGVTNRTLPTNPALILPAQLCRQLASENDVNTKWIPRSENIADELTGARPKSVLRHLLLQGKTPIIPKENITHAAISLGAVTGLPKAWDIFAGVKSTASVLQGRYFDVDTLDIDPKRHCTWTNDILHWNYEQAWRASTRDGANPVRFAFFAPPCSAFSNMRHLPGRPPLPEQDIAHAIAIMIKVFEVIAFLKRKLAETHPHLTFYWCVENPLTGRAKELPFLKDVKRMEISLCKFGALWNKPTAVWTNVPALHFSSLCRRGSPCQRLARAQRLGLGYDDTHVSCLQVTSEDLYYLPAPLIKLIGKKVTEAMRSDEQRHLQKAHRQDIIRGKCRACQVRNKDPKAPSLVSVPSLGYTCVACAQHLEQCRREHDMLLG